MNTEDSLEDILLRYSESLLALIFRLGLGEGHVLLLLRCFYERVLLMLEMS